MRKKFDVYSLKVYGIETYYWWGKKEKRNLYKLCFNTTVVKLFGIHICVVIVGIYCTKTGHKDIMSKSEETTAVDIGLNEHSASGKPLEFEEKSGNDSKESKIDVGSAVLDGDKTDKLNKNFDSYIYQIKERRQKLYDELKQLEREIIPREFESYNEYYLIKNFKVGKSASGRVNVEGLRSRGNGGPYRRLKRASRRGSPHNSRDTSRYSSDGNSEDEVSKSDSETGEPHNNDVEYKPSSWKINRDITTSSIIEEDSNGPVRRSTRLTRKEKERQITKEKRKKKELENKEKERDSSVSDTEYQSCVIQHLYENLIQKIEKPVRRSDWLLPPKNRYIPEKNQPVKHEPEQIKINELARNSRIKKVLSRFDGGLAGVRTSN